MPSVRVPEFILRVKYKFKMRKSLFGAALFGITSPFSLQAKSSAARGQLDFFLRNNFLWWESILNAIKILVELHPTLFSEFSLVHFNFRRAVDPRRPLTAKNSTYCRGSKFLHITLFYRCILILIVYVAEGIASINHVSVK